MVNKWLAWISILEISTNDNSAALVSFTCCQKKSDWRSRPNTSNSSLCFTCFLPFCQRNEKVKITNGDFSILRLQQHDISTYLSTKNTLIQLALRCFTQCLSIEPYRNEAPGMSSFSEYTIYNCWCLCQFSSPSIWFICEPCHWNSY